MHFSHYELVINLNIYIFYILDPLTCTEAWTMPFQRVSITFVMKSGINAEISFTWHIQCQNCVLWQHYSWSITQTSPSYQANKYHTQLISFKLDTDNLNLIKYQDDYITCVIYNTQLSFYMYDKDMYLLKPKVNETWDNFNERMSKC